ncbi:MAG: hypothetical protein KDC05_06265 [Bacteroidales bacterium]|nr:hypothetical protein [Bacteroidales bacterium]
MGKGIKYKRQVLQVSMSEENIANAYVLDAEILSYSKRVTHITMYTKDARNISYKNCQLYEPLKINDNVIYPTGFDAYLLYPIPGSDCEIHQEVNIPLENGARIKGRFTNPNSAQSLIIVLQLETQ